MNPVYGYETLCDNDYSGNCTWYALLCNLVYLSCHPSPLPFKYVVLAHQI
jgi:hypothetical protein